MEAAVVSEAVVGISSSGSSRRGHCLRRRRRLAVVLPQSDTLSLFQGPTQAD